ncbi:MAG: hypothetical protein WD874_00190 [Parcubacteria group bacterium]
MPLQPPEAVQEVVFEDDHESVELCPALMLVGSAEKKMSIGGAVVPVLVNMWHTLRLASVCDLCTQMLVEPTLRKVSTPVFGFTEIISGFSEYHHGLHEPDVTVHVTDTPRTVPTG